MAELAFHRITEFTKSLLMAIWNEQGVVAKTVFAARGFLDVAFTSSVENFWLVVLACLGEGDHTAETRGAVMGGTSL